MQLHPFAILRPFQNRLGIEFLTREDGASSDSDIARITARPRLASLHQVHDTSAVRVDTETNRTLQADALATAMKGLTLTIRFADCQNFIVFDPTKNVMCLIHAGWRGLAKGILRSTFEFLKKEWGVEAADVLIAAGPSLCFRCAEFTDPVTEVPALVSFTDGKRIDLMCAADTELASLGVTPEHFERIPGCTKCSADRYFTYRGGDREAVQRGFTNCLAVTLMSST